MLYFKNTVHGSFGKNPGETVRFLLSHYETFEKSLRFQQILNKSVMVQTNNFCGIKTPVNTKLKSCDGSQNRSSIPLSSSITVSLYSNFEILSNNVAWHKNARLVLLSQATGFLSAASCSWLWSTADEQQNGGSRQLNVPQVFSLPPKMCSSEIFWTRAVVFAFNGFFFFFFGSFQWTCLAVFFLNVNSHCSQNPDSRGYTAYIHGM